jgi:hypothetical protein
MVTVFKQTEFSVSGRELGVLLATVSNLAKKKSNKRYFNNMNEVYKRETVV